MKSVVRGDVNGVNPGERVGSTILTNPSVSVHTTADRTQRRACHQNKRTSAPRSDDAAPWEGTRVATVALPNWSFWGGDGG